MTVDHAAQRIQFAYPQVYYACHTRHQRARSSAAALSARDAQILVHLDRREPMTLSDLAAHMDLSASTMSEAVTRLGVLGFVVKARVDAGDRRRVGIVLTAKAVAAVRAGSVLETPRLTQVLRRLPSAERARVVAGLEVLAESCRALLAGKRAAGRRR